MKPVHNKGVCQQERSLGSSICLKFNNSLFHSTLKPVENLNCSDNKVKEGLTHIHWRKVDLPYVLRQSELILPQKEKKSVTVFSLALGEMFATNTLLFG